MKYIAYGSNMAQDQMAYRCPHAKLIGTGTITKTRLEFYIHATVHLTDGTETEGICATASRLLPSHNAFSNSSSTFFISLPS